MTHEEEEEMLHDISKLQDQVQKMSASQKFFVGFAATAIAGIGLLLYGNAKSKEFDLSIDM